MKKIVAYFLIVTIIGFCLPAIFARQMSNYLRKVDSWYDTFLDSKKMQKIGSWIDQNL